MRYAIGIDIGGTKIAGGLVHKNRIVKRTEIAAGKGMVNRIKDLISRLLKTERPFRIGIGCAGLVDSKRGIVYYSPNILEFRNTRLARIIEHEFRIKTLILNDVNAFLLGEWLYGAGKGYKNLVGLTVGTGIGGAAVVDKRLLWGDRFMGGEFGHMVIDEDGPRCSCGKKGCLEIMAAQKAIIRMAKKRKLARTDPKGVAELAKKGNQRAIRIYDQIGYHLAVGIGNLVNIFAPEAVIIGGGIGNAGRILFDPIRRYVKKQVMGYEHRDLKILKTELGNRANIIGAGGFEKKFLPSP